MADHRSVSQLLKYSSCSEQYRLEYVDKVHNNYRPAAWLAQGSAFHEAVQGWEESGRSPQFDIGQTYVVSYDREIEAYKTREPNLKKWMHSFKITTEDDIDARKALGLKHLQNYVDYAEANNFIIKDIDEFNLAVEVPFEVQIGPVLVKGAIDLILLDPHGVEVRDLKTGNREANNLQLAIYTLVVEKIFKWPVVRASYLYTKDNKLVTLSRKDLDRYDEKYLTELFTALDSGIHNKVFIPNPGSQCTFCPVKDYCREMGSQPRSLGSQS